LRLFQALAEVRVKSVFDGIVSAAVNLLGDVTPAIAMDEVELDDEHVFFHGPLAFSDVRVQVVVPALTALLSNATG